VETCLQFFDRSFVLARKRQRLGKAIIDEMGLSAKARSNSAMAASCCRFLPAKHLYHLTGINQPGLPQRGHP
jgi:hypothetical protein